MCMLLLENLISSNLVDSDFFFNQVILFSSHLLGRFFFFFWGGSQLCFSAGKELWEYQNNEVEECINQYIWFILEYANIANDPKSHHKTWMEAWSKILRIS